MGDIGPSLTKLRRDWREGSVEVPAGMIARRVLMGAIDKLGEGQSLIVSRVGDRRFRIEQHRTGDR
jgi:hypothetical protein